MGCWVGKVRMARLSAIWVRLKGRPKMLGQDGNLIVGGGIFLGTGRSGRAKCRSMRGVDPN
jgi:hypothetical protein